jgi:GTP cyclohydrolase III
VFPLQPTINDAAARIANCNRCSLDAMFLFLRFDLAVNLASNAENAIVSELRRRLRKNCTIRLKMQANASVMTLRCVAARRAFLAATHRSIAAAGRYRPINVDDSVTKSNLLKYYL